MCRMVSLASPKITKIEPYFKVVVEQALHGKHSPHGDGWGMALYSKKGLTLKKSAQPIWEVKDILEEANIALIHARKTTSGDVKASFSHPLLSSCNGKDWSFAHNGAINNFSHPLKIDTQFYFEKFLFHLKAFNNVVQAMKSTFGEIEKNYEYTSLNAFISNGEELYAFRKVKEDDDDYHSIFYKLENDIVIFSTEKFGNNWKALKNGEYAYAKVDEKEIRFEVRGW